MRNLLAQQKHLLYYPAWIGRAGAGYLGLWDLFHKMGFDTGFRETLPFEHRYVDIVWRDLLK